MLEGVYADPVTGNRLVPIQCDAQGRLVVSGGVGGGGGSSDTTEATQLLVKAAVQTIATRTPASPATAAGQDTANAAVGTPGDVAAAADDSAAGIIALLKRGLVRWTALLARLPASLGAKASAASLPVVIASDQSAVAVAATARTCTGRQTLALTANVVTTLTVPANSVAAAIQADGNTIRVTLSGADPTATVGTRIDDGVIYYVDTALASVKLLAPVACSAQIVYFDKA